MALAEGPILISTGVGGDDADLAGVLRRGRIVAGGTSKIDRRLSLFLRNDYRSFRNAKRIANRIGERFHSPDEYGLRKPLAEAKTDQRIQIDLHPLYEGNYPRYLQVIRSVAFRETEIARRVRLRKLEDDITKPELAASAALQLEAIGEASIPALQRALEHSSPEVRFHAASALVYLEDASGLKVLAESAREEPAFRIFALAALASSKEVEASMLLRELLSEPSTETRYGAFRALTKLGSNDPLVKGEPMFAGRTPEPGSPPAYRLHVLNTDGPPLVHLTHRGQTEIVIFGADQEMKLPLALRAGNHIIVSAPPGSDKVSVSRFQVGRPDRKEIVSPRIEEIIRACDSLGASYPDIAGMLAQAERQSNLPGAIAVDELPEAGRLYYRDGGGDVIGGRRETRVGNDGIAPNLFPTNFSEDSASNAEDDARDDLFLDLGESPGDPPAETETEVEEDVEADAEAPTVSDASDETERPTDEAPLELPGGEEENFEQAEAPSQGSGFQLLSLPKFTLPRLPSFGGGVPEQSEPALPPQGEPE